MLRNKNGDGRTLPFVVVTQLINTAPLKGVCGQPQGHAAIEQKAVEIGGIFAEDFSGAELLPTQFAFSFCGSSSAVPFRQHRMFPASSAPPPREQEA